MSQPMLTIHEEEIRRHGPGNVLRVVWRQWRMERGLARRGILYRTTDPNEAESAYGAMSEQEFDTANARQAWANWRTIPRALSGHVPDRALRVLDLGCGTGQSTQVLAFYCPAGSHITGYELARPMVELARRRRYSHKDGQPANVDFVCQGVTETLRAADGSALADQSVDVANASGVVGHHLNVQTVQPLVEELRRLLKPGGVAMLDVGPTLRDGALTPIMEAAGFTRLGRWRSWVIDPTGEVVYQVRDSVGHASPGLL